MVEIFAALQFLTIFPPVIKRPFSTQELGRSVGYYPLVGLLLGAVMAGLYWLFGLIFPDAVVALIVLVVWVSFTRALHVDGFMDCCDGLFGGFTPERRLEIMRDSRVGAFGVVGGILLLMAKFILLLSQNNAILSLLLVPAFGRWVLTFGIVLFPYTREKGMGRDIKNNTSWTQLVIATSILIIAAWFLAGWSGLLLIPLAALIGFLWFKYVMSLIPGLTGDVYGAACEIVEVLVMLVGIPILL